MLKQQMIGGKGFRLMFSRKAKINPEYCFPEGKESMAVVEAATYGIEEAFEELLKQFDIDDAKYLANEAINSMYFLLEVFLDDLLYVLNTEENARETISQIGVEINLWLTEEKCIRCEINHKNLMETLKVYGIGKDETMEKIDFIEKLTSARARETCEYIYEELDEVLKTDRG